MRAGADGVVQAMVLSLVGLKYRQHHLELDANPKDLHREYQVRRVSYGNETHLNISIALESDNKAVIEVTLDRKSQDYFACDAGCLDPPVKLSSSEVTRFPVKLTDPVTAVLYITSDYEHMMELKHTIHVKEVGFGEVFFLLQSNPYKMFAAYFQPPWPSRPKTKGSFLFYFLKLYNFGFKEIVV